MVVSPQDFLVHAKKLINPNNRPNEIDCRSAVSRAYYSLFHEASDFLQSRGLYTKTTDRAHSKIKNVLLDLDANAGLQFDSYRGDRVKADYDLPSAFYNQNTSEVKVKDIENFITTIKKL
jgi:uncharacterized protein (UPF0332 family)